MVCHEFLYLRVWSDGRRAIGRGFELHADHAYDNVYVDDDDDDDDDDDEIDAADDDDDDDDDNDDNRSRHHDLVGRCSINPTTEASVHVEMLAVVYCVVLPIVMLRGLHNRRHRHRRRHRSRRRCHPRQRERERERRNGDNIREVQGW